MKYLSGITAVVFALVVGIQAEIRIWTAADGSSTIEASLVRVDGKKVELARKDGRHVTVPIDKLCEADREYLADQRQDGADGSQATPSDAVDLPYEVGRVTGPIAIDDGCRYFYYVPTSLKPGRNAPMLLYSHLGGGSANQLQKLVEGAELCQWVLAISEEARRDTPDDAYDADMAVYSKHGDKVLEDIMETLPVEERRLYFLGHSTGCSIAFYNYENHNGYGLMPSIGIIPLEFSAPRCDCFIISGTWDYCRYASAYARKAIGDSAIHRFHANGHLDAPGWLMVEGMVWFEGRYLSKKGKKHPDVQREYEAAVLEWIERLGTKEPHRAYYWALFLQEELPLSANNASKVASLIKELGADQNNRLYVEGIAEIDEFSVRKLSKYGRIPLFEHTDDRLVKEWEGMLEKYKGVPVIEELLKSFCHPTDHSK